MQRLIITFKVLLIQNVIISIHLLCVDGLLLIISHQEDESIWKILAMENLPPKFGFKTFIRTFKKRLSSFSIISLLEKQFWQWVSPQISYHHQELTTGGDSCQIFILSSKQIQGVDDVWPQGAYVMFE